MSQSEFGAAVGKKRAAITNWESGRLPEKLRQQLQRRIFDARASAARTERENGDVLEHIDACIEACGRNGDPRPSS